MMKELAKEYKKSAKLISDKITKIKNDPSCDEDRLKPLIIMLNDLREVTKEIEHYYDRWWWRSAKYTLNRNGPKQDIYSEPFYDEAGNERRRKRRNESLFGSGYSIVTYGKTKKSNGDVL